MQWRPDVDHRQKFLYNTIPGKTNRTFSPQSHVRYTLEQHSQAQNRMPSILVVHHYLKNQMTQPEPKRRASHDEQHAVRCSCVCNHPTQSHGRGIQNRVFVPRM